MPRVQVQALIGRGGKLTHRCQAQPTLAWHGMAWRLEHQPTPVSLGAAHDGGRAGEGASEQVACQEPGMPWLVECVGRVGGGLSARHRLASHCTASQPPLCFGQTDRSDKHKRMRSSIEKSCERNLGNARRAGLRAHARSLARSLHRKDRHCTDARALTSWSASLGAEFQPFGEIVQNVPLPAHRLRSSFLQPILGLAGKTLRERVQGAASCRSMSTRRDVIADLPTVESPRW